MEGNASAPTPHWGLNTGTTAAQLQKQLLCDPTYSDITITCRDKTFRCHRSVLCPRVPFFAACCKHGFKEAETQTITLPDDDPIAVQVMLEYVYTLQLPNWGDVVAVFEDDLARMASLFTISNKYDILALKGYAKSKVLENFKCSVRSTALRRVLLITEEEPEALCKSFRVYEQQVVDLISLIFGSDDATVAVFKAPMIKTMVEDHGIFKDEKLSAAIHWSPDLASHLVATFGDAMMTAKKEVKTMEGKNTTLRRELRDEKNMHEKEVKSVEAKSHELGQMKEELRRTQALLKEARESNEQGTKRPAKKAKRTK